jgi:D-alanyl-D-alanine carboxypeptidase
MMKRLTLTLLIALILALAGPLVTRGPAQAAARQTAATEAVPPAADQPLQSLLDAVVTAGASGIIPRVDDGHHVTALTSGSARLQPRRALQVSDSARVGSITKTFMSIVTLQLVAEGRLRLDDTVARRLPGAVPGGASITIRELLNHTSGLFNYTDDQQAVKEYLADPTRAWTPQELLAVAVKHPPLFPPGTSWSYSNTNYIVLGLVLEAVTGRDVATLMRERIVRPLHLDHTFLALDARIPGPHADGYFPPSLSGTSGYLDVTGWTPTEVWAAGAVVSSAPDLARLYSALLSGRLLPPPLLDQMTTTVHADTGWDYGLGIYRMVTPCGTVWGHDGSIPGYVSLAWADRQGQRSVVLLLPTQPDAAIGEAFVQAETAAVCQMFGRGVPSQPSTSAPPTVRASGGGVDRLLPSRPATSVR